MKDICLFISDQHSFFQQHYAGDGILRTPNLDRIAAEGVAFMNNCTSYPLCVPARMGLMSGQLASRCGVMGNFSVLDSSRATFAHSLNSIGYETVLCGRMHFVGPDQRHGFSKRLVGDITPTFTNRPSEAFRKERGVHLNTPTGGAHCVSIIGAGNSPTLEFDRAVVSAALDYLKDSYEKPQFFCVGTYAPHHPYVAPKELYDYYYEKVDSQAGDFPLPSFYSGYFNDSDPEVVRAVRAAYYGMCEFVDQEVGMVYDAFQAYLKRTGREGIFIYASDHGDQIGSRGLYGKQTFYEESVHTPLIIAGDGIRKGVRIEGATSLLDLGPTLCELTGAPVAADCDGISLCDRLSGDVDDMERMVISELGGTVDRKRGRVDYAQMVKRGSLKFVHYEGLDEDAVYDVSTDPHEVNNIIADQEDFAAAARACLKEKCAPLERIEENAWKEAKNLAITMRCSFDSPERWRAPDAARHYPEEMVSSSKKPAPLNF